jgi:hypothetical protein
MTASDRSISARALAAALPDLCMGAVYLAAWIAPARLGAQPIAPLTLIMLLEFLVVHSGGFAGKVMLGPLRSDRKVTALIGLGIFYTLFVAAFALAFRTWWPVVSFWVLMMNRMLSVLLGQAQSGDERAMLQRGWAAGVLFYLAFGGLTTMVPMPRLGLTSDLLASQHLPGSGLWIDQPWRVMAFGFLYFTATGLSELVEHRWLGNSARLEESKAA